ncbi:MAG: thioredoxin family protein [Planctomycetota bacterium]|jgi:hypothetical protein
MTRLSIPVILALFCAAFTAPVHGQGEGGDVPEGKVAWITDHKVAAAMAVKEGKLIIVDLYASWSPWSKKLNAETFPHPDVQALLQKLVPLRLDPKKDQLAKILMRQAGARRFPATIIVDPGWRVLKLITGYLPPESFVADLKKVTVPFETFQELTLKMKDGELGYEDPFRYVDACNRLKMRKETRKWGEKILAMEKGTHHADTAFYLARSYKVGSEEFEKYKKLTLEHDSDNMKGYHDEFLIDDAFAILKSIESEEDRAAKVTKATAMLESRLAQKKQMVHRQKAQIMYGLLFQIVYRNGRGDLAKSVEYLEKGIACDASTEDGKRMTRLLGKIKVQLEKTEAEKKKEEGEEK